MARKTYYLFRYSAKQFRWGEGLTLSEASMNAFGTDYTKGARSEVLHKVYGTRKPTTISAKGRAELYSERNWLDMQGKPRAQCPNCGKAVGCECRPSEKVMAASLRAAPNPATKVIKVKDCPEGMPDFAVITKATELRQAIKRLVEIHNEIAALHEEAQALAVKHLSVNDYNHAVGSGWACYIAMSLDSDHGYAGSIDPTLMDTVVKLEQLRQG